MCTGKREFLCRRPSIPSKSRDANQIKNIVNTSMHSAKQQGKRTHHVAKRKIFQNRARKEKEVEINEVGTSACNHCRILTLKHITGQNHPKSNIQDAFIENAASCSSIFRLAVSALTYHVKKLFVRVPCNGLATVHLSLESLDLPVA
jgi:plasmid rolling circle replication initiator protein Rep